MSRQRCGFRIYNKVQIGVFLSKLCLVFFLPPTFWCKSILHLKNYSYGEINFPCHNLIAWLIPEQCNILSNTVAFSRFSVSGHDRKKWLCDGGVMVEKETESTEQVNDTATALH